MDKKTWGIIGALVLIFAVLAGIGIWQRKQESAANKSYNREDIVALAADIDLAGTDLAKIIPASKQSGNLPENLVGSSDAEILVFEYADYQCEHCAAINPYVNRLVEDYGGKVAVVYRNYLLPYHSNAVAAASAANAAAIQGFWKDYKNMLFSNQNDWYFATTAKAVETFEEYFKQIAGDNGDLNKFKADMESDAVEQKVAFDLAAGEAAGIAGTPSLYFNGEHVDQSGMTYSAFFEKLHELIDAELAKRK